MDASERLQVRVNDDLVLDAGTCGEASGLQGPERLICPPATTLFHQVLAYLERKRDPPRRPSGSMVGREGVAAAALTLRWGSYLAVLFDHDKPGWPEIQSMHTSRISDAEMARINIEASAALAEWIDIYREDPDGRLYERLVNRAVFYLPMPRKTSRLKVTEFAVLAKPEIAERVVRMADPARLEHVRADVARHASRVLANALLNTAWRNGPVEDIHAGRYRGYPLDQRRVSAAEERESTITSPTGGGVYLTVEGVFALGRFIERRTGGVMAPGEARVVSRLFLYGHEACHHAVECFATRLEVTHRTALYRRGFEALYQKTAGTDDAHEEALATAKGYALAGRVGRRLFKGQPAKRRAVLAALADYIVGCPPGYRPRHPGDLRTGTLAKIIKQAGLAMSVEEFVRA
jgi:hypothetical protein